MQAADGSCCCQTTAGRTIMAVLPPTPTLRPSSRIKLTVMMWQDGFQASIFDRHVTLSAQNQGLVTVEFKATKPLVSASPICLFPF